MGKGPPGLKSGGGQMTHGTRGKVVLEDDMTGEGPTLAKHRAAEKDGIARAPLIWALRSRSSKSCAPDSGPPPPPPLKGRKVGGGPEFPLSSLIRAC
jgi:hypothetical protein